MNYSIPKVRARARPPDPGSPRDIRQHLPAGRSGQRVGQATGRSFGQRRQGPSQRRGSPVMIKIIAVLCSLASPARCREQTVTPRTSPKLDAVLPDGRAAARRVDEAASGRTPCGMALRDRQTGSQGSLARDCRRARPDIRLRRKPPIVSKNGGLRYANPPCAHYEFSPLHRPRRQPVNQMPLQEREQYRHRHRAQNDAGR